MDFKRTAIFVMVFALVAAPWCAMASSKVAETDYQITAAAMTGDVIVARPIGVVSVVLGFGLFVISSPFSALGGNIGNAWGILVVKPTKFTFVRPLGDFDGSGDP